MKITLLRLFSWRTVELRMPRGDELLRIVGIARMLPPSRRKLTEDTLPYEVGRVVTLCKLSWMIMDVKIEPRQNRVTHRMRIDRTKLRGAVRFRTEPSDSGIVPKGPTYSRALRYHLALRFKDNNAIA